MHIGGLSQKFEFNATDRSTWSNIDIPPPQGKLFETLWYIFCTW